MRRLLLLVPVCLWLTACGAEAPVDDPSPLTGPPSWWAVREGLGERMDAIHLRAGGPCEVLLAVDGVEGGRHALAPRRLFAGETVQIWWAAIDSTPGQPPEAAAAEGRTESHRPGYEFGFRDRGTAAEHMSLFARPGRGQVHRASVLPPPTPELLEPGREIELAVAVAADLDAGRELRLVPRPEGHRVEPDPEGLEPPERARVLRLTLVVRDVGKP